MLYRSARAQGDYFGGFASREPLFDFRHVLLFEIPYIREKLSVYLLGATLRHIGARFSAITEHAAHHTEKAGEAREIEENHRIAFCKAHRQSAGIVSSIIHRGFSGSAASRSSKSSLSDSIQPACHQSLSRWTSGSPVFTESSKASVDLPAPGEPMIRTFSIVHLLLFYPYDIIKNPFRQCFLQ